MKILTITTDDDNGTQTAVHTTQAAADAQAREIVAAWFERHGAADGQERGHEDWRESYEILCDTVGFMHSLTLEEHDTADPAQTSPEAQAYRDAAKRQHHRECECEIDDNATVSFGDDAGAYVQAWVWIPAADAGVDVEE